MKIYADGSDQTLICLDYDFAQDSPAFRGLSRQRFGEGIEIKGTWNYEHAHKGLCVLVAYEGTRAVGQVEFLPIEHAPQPVSGEGLTFINCLAVMAQAQGRGIGSALLEACRTEAMQRSDGLACLAYLTGPFMPAAFFRRHGLRLASTAEDAELLYQTWADAQPPELLPRLLAPRPEPGRVTVDYFWCGQCPHAARTRDRLRQVARQLGPRVLLRETNTDDRATLQRWGIASGLYVNGRQVFCSPPRLAEWEIRQALEGALNAT